MALVKSDGFCYFFGTTLFLPGRVAQSLSYARTPDTSTSDVNCRTDRNTPEFPPRLTDSRGHTRWQQGAAKNRVKSAGITSPRIHTCSLGGKYPHSVANMRALAVLDVCCNVGGLLRYHAGSPVEAVMVHVYITVMINSNTKMIKPKKSAGSGFKLPAVVQEPLGHRPGGKPRSAQMQNGVKSVPR